MTRPPTRTALLILTIAAIGWWAFTETVVAAPPPKQARIAQTPVPFTDTDLQAVTLQAEAFYARTTGKTTGCTVRNWVQLDAFPPLAAPGTVAWAGGPCDAWYMPEILSYTPANFCAIVTHEVGHWLGYRHDENGDALDGAPPIMDYDTMYAEVIPECGVDIPADVPELEPVNEVVVVQEKKKQRPCRKQNRRRCLAKRDAFVWAELHPAFDYFDVRCGRKACRWTLQDVDRGRDCSARTYGPVSCKRWRIPKPD